MEVIASESEHIASCDGMYLCKFQAHHLAFNEVPLGPALTVDSRLGKYAIFKFECAILDVKSCASAAAAQAIAAPSCFQVK